MGVQMIQRLDTEVLQSIEKLTPEYKKACNPAQVANASKLCQIVTTASLVSRSSPFLYSMKDYVKVQSDDPFCIDGSHENAGIQQQHSQLSMTQASEARPSMDMLITRPIQSILSEYSMGKLDE